MNQMLNNKWNVAKSEKQHLRNYVFKSQKENKKPFRGISFFQTRERAFSMTRVFEEKKNLKQNKLIK